MIWLIAASIAAAPYADTQLPDPAQEKQAHDLMLELRCLVCQGQSIADSDADMAGDMRSLVRTRVEAGESPEEIRTYLTDRYGDWVSYKPSISKPLLWPLYLAPLVLVGIAAFLLRRRFRKPGGAE